MDRQKEIYRCTIVGSVANAALLVFKLLAGIFGHSTALIADALHSLSDFITDVIVLAFVKISGKPCDVDHQYGHGKYETMATAIIGTILMGVGLGIFWNGAKQVNAYLNGAELEGPGMLALAAALVSILVKELLYRYTINVGKRVGSQAVMANAWHHRSDAMSSIATAIGVGGAILLGEKWRVLDPIAALIVSVLIVKVAISIVVPSINELLEKSLPKETEAEIINVINSFPEVSEPHHLRTRRIGPVASVEVHVRMDGNMTVRDSHQVTRNIEQKIRELLGPETIINIHVEPAK